MQFLRFLLFPFAILYGIPVSLRNWFYKIGLFKSSKFSMPIISVGNLNVGGSGKTPHVEYLIELLKEDHKLATVSRGFGRKERGFKIADEQTNYLQIGDEPMQYYVKYGDQIKVVAEANRVRAVMDLMHQEPDTELVLLDDAYQHRAIHRGMNILLSRVDKPYFKDFILPIGELREGRWNANRADIIVITACSEFENIDRSEMEKNVKLKNHQSLFFSKVDYGTINSLHSSESLSSISNRNIVLVTGIANETALVKQLSAGNQILHHFRFKDHHNFRLSDVQRIQSKFDTFAEQNPILITSEKDAMRLKREELANVTNKYPWYYQTIKVVIDKPEEFNKLIKDYVEANISNH